MKNKLTTTMLLICIALGIHAKQLEQYYVKIDKTTEGKFPKILPFDSQDKSKQKSKIIIYPNAEFQTIDGIGGSFNEIGGEALLSLDQNQQAKVMENLFGENVCNFSLCRTAVGSSDFGIDAYSYSDSENDFEMEKFSIERDKKYVLPYINTALKYNPSLTIFASPWSPPAWMKYSKLMDQGASNPKVNKLIDSPQIYSAYAKFFRKYIDLYQQNGVNIDRLIVQNETDVNAKYPSCYMTVAEMSKLVNKYIYPEFKRYNVSSEIWAGSYRTISKLDAIEYLADETNLKFIDGVGIQYSNPKYISQITAIRPNVNIMHTEGNCFDGKNSIEQAFTRLAEVASYINNGVSNYCYWNMILNETGKSGWDWKQNSLINIDRDSKNVTYNPDFAVMFLLSKYIQPGSIRLGHMSNDEILTIRKDGNIYLFVQNSSDDLKSFDLEVGGDNYQISIPIKSVSVVVIKN
jgi:glucosylceramidase